MIKRANSKTRTSKVNRKCRSEFYPRTNIARFCVPDDKVSWQVKWPEYDPAELTAPHILDQPWADPDISNTAFRPRWNALDSNNVDRTSACGPYEIVDGRPRNPIGRTGLRGRGILDRWGPNKIADPIVTRWKDDGCGGACLDDLSKKPILQFLAVERGNENRHQWAIPGGPVNVGEHVSGTLRRALNINAKSQLQSFFASGIGIFNGYVDDSRNTDNAWIETMAVHFHDKNNQIVFPSQTDLKVQWIDINADLKLYANHIKFLKVAARQVNAHWSNL